MATAGLTWRGEHAALGLLADGREWFGLDLVKRSRGDLTRGTVYVILDQLEHKGYVESEQEPVPVATAGYVPRRRYRITAAGRKALRAAQWNR